MGLNSKDAASVPTSTEATLHHGGPIKEHLLADRAVGAADVLVLTATLWKKKKEKKNPTEGTGFNTFLRS